MEFIKYLDFFSIKFHFYTNNQPNFQNIFGGIMTFIYVLLCAGLFYIFSYDDIYRLNPITLRSEITDSTSRLVNIKNEKIWIPFRIISENNKFLNHNGIFHISPYFVESEFNDETGLNLKYHLLNYKLCNETSMVNKPKNYKIDVSLNELFCIAQEDINFGGNLKENFISYIEINLFLCKEGINFNSSNSNCSNIKDLFNNSNISFSLDFYYPVVQFQPTNFETPIAIIYKNFIYRLDNNSFKIEKLYLQEHILSDDINFIKSNYKNSSYWGISSFYGDNYYLPNENYNNYNGRSSRIYSLKIYMDDGLIYYTRSYQKLILIISNIFPLFKLLLYFIKLLTKQVKTSLIKMKLAGLIFEKKELKSNKVNLNMEKENFLFLSNKSNKKSLKDNSNINSNYQEKKSVTDEHNNKNGKNLVNYMNNKTPWKNENEFSKSIIVLSNENAIKLINKKDIFSIEKKNKTTKLNESLKVKEKPGKINTIKNKPKEIYLFPYYYFFFDIIFDKLIRPQKFFCLSKAYFTVYNFMGQIYDISTHIILFKQFNSLNKIVMEKIYEENGVCPAKRYVKININDIKMIEKLNKDLKKNKSILFSHNLL